MDEVIAAEDAATQLAQLVARAHAGERIVILAADGATAALAATGQDPPPRHFGGWRGKVWIAQDFDDPLPADLAQAFDPDADSA